MFTEKDQLRVQEDRNGFDQEQYDILRRCSEKKNIAEWNKYRAEHPETQINLQNADLRRAKLEGAQFSEGNFQGAQFEEADLFAADFRNADLRKANFQGASLWGAALREANLEGACFISANLENADLRKANVERADFHGANLEEAIIPETVDENLRDSIKCGSIEQVEVAVNLVDDITYEEFISLIKCLERLSIVFGGSLPHLNEIHISHHIEEQPAWAGTEMDNMISLNIPKNVEENLHGILHVGVTTAQTPKKASVAEKVVEKNNSEPCDGLREILANTELPENERKAVLANLASAKMEADKLMEDIQVVANLEQSGRIYFRI